MFANKANKRNNELQATLQNVLFGYDQFEEKNIASAVDSYLTHYAERIFERRTAYEELVERMNRGEDVLYLGLDKVKEEYQDLRFQMFKFQSYRDLDTDILVVDSIMPPIPKKIHVVNNFRSPNEITKILPIEMPIAVDKNYGTCILSRNGSKIDIDIKWDDKALGTIKDKERVAKLKEATSKTIHVNSAVQAIEMSAKLSHKMNDEFKLPGVSTKRPMVFVQDRSFDENNGYSLLIHYAEMKLKQYPNKFLNNRYVFDLPATRMERAKQHLLKVIPEKTDSSALSNEEKLKLAEELIKANNLIGKDDAIRITNEVLIAKKWQPIKDSDV